MDKTIILNTNKLTTEPNGGTVEVTLNNIYLDEIISQFTSAELLQAISAHYDFSTIFDWVTNELKDEEE